MYWDNIQTRKRKRGEKEPILLSKYLLNMRLHVVDVMHLTKRTILRLMDPIFEKAKEHFHDRVEAEQQTVSESAVLVTIS